MRSQSKRPFYSGVKDGDVSLPAKPDVVSHTQSMSNDVRLQPAITGFHVCSTFVICVVLFLLLLSGVAFHA